MRLFEIQPSKSDAGNDWVLGVKRGRTFAIYGDILIMQMWEQIQTLTAHHRDEPRTQ